MCQGGKDMKYVFAAVAIVQGFFFVGLLMLLEMAVNALAPGLGAMPFSPWWGMLASVPGVVMAAHIMRNG
jgi:hypothetical protein